MAEPAQHDYEIELLLQQIRMDPGNVELHQSLRHTSLVRTSEGGRDLGMFQKMKLRRDSDDPVTNTVNASRLLAYSPGDTEWMLRVLRAAHAGGYDDVADWIGRILRKAEDDSR